MRKFILVLFLLFLPYLAQSSNNSQMWELEYPTLAGVTFPSPTTTVDTLVQYTKYIYNFGLFLGIILALVMMVIGGFRYMYSEANPQTRSSAKDQILKAFGGLILLIGSYYLLASVAPDLVILNPPGVTKIRLRIVPFKRSTVPWSKLVTTIEPPTMPVELTYPTVGGFRPEVIPFVTTVPYWGQFYPLDIFLSHFIRYLYNFSVILGIILSLVFLLLGAFRHSTAGGDINKLNDARNQIFSSLLGLLLLLGSYLILAALRPEFVLISPWELEEPPIEIKEGVYLCRGEMGSGNNDLFAKYLRYQFLKRVDDSKAEDYKLTKKQLKMVNAFIISSCYLIDHQQNLPFWISGEAVMPKDEVEKALDEAVLSGTIDISEKQDILEELYSGGWGSSDVDLFVYFNGPYGAAFHTLRDFKGSAYFVFQYSIGQKKLEEIKNKVPIFNYRPETFLQAISQWFKGEEGVFIKIHLPKGDEFRPIASVTLFKDFFLECTMAAWRGEINDGNKFFECLRLVKDANNIQPGEIEQNTTFSFYRLRDFNQSEITEEPIPQFENEVLPLEWKVQWGNEFIGSTVINGEQKNYTANYLIHTFYWWPEGFQYKCWWEERVEGTPPMYSFRLPEYPSWIFAVADFWKLLSLNDPYNQLKQRVKVQIFEQSDRDLSDEYAREFGKITKKIEESVPNNPNPITKYIIVKTFPSIPCVFIWPGQIVKAGSEK